MSKTEKALKRWLLREASQKLRSPLTKTAANRTLPGLFLKEFTERTDKARLVRLAGLQSGSGKRGGENYVFGQYSMPSQRIRMIQKELADRFGKSVYGLLTEEASGGNRDHQMNVADLSRYVGSSGDNAFPIGPTESNEYRTQLFKPSNVYFVFPYEASVIPVNDPDSLKASTQVLHRATQLFNFPFAEFIKDIMTHRISLDPYFQKSSWSEGEGQVGDTPWAVKLDFDMMSPNTIARAAQSVANKHLGRGSGAVQSQLINQVVHKFGEAFESQQGVIAERVINAFNQAMSGVFGNLPPSTIQEYIDEGMQEYTREAKEYAVDGIIRATQPRQRQRHDRIHPLTAAWTLKDVTLENAIKNRRRYYTVDSASLKAAIAQLKKRKTHINDKELEARILDIDRFGCIPVIVEKMNDMFDDDGRAVSTWRLKDAKGQPVSPLDILKGVLGKKITEKRYQKMFEKMRYGEESLELDPTDIDPSKAIQATQDEMDQANITLDEGQMAILVSLPRARPIRVSIDELKNENNGEFSFDEYGNIQRNVVSNADRLRNTQCALLNNDELRVYLLSLTKQRPGMKVYPEGIELDDRPISEANGLSSYYDPRSKTTRTNWSLPSMRMLPNGQMISDTDNGNCGMVHMRKNWNRNRNGTNMGLKPFLTKWGQRCTQLMTQMVTFSGKAQEGIRAAQWKQKESDSSDAMIADAIAAVIGDGKHAIHTNADNWLTILKERPSMDSSDPHKSLRNLVSTPQRGAVSYAHRCAQDNERQAPQISTDVQQGFDYSINNNRLLSVVAQLRKQLNEKAQTYAPGAKLADTPLAAEIDNYCRYLTDQFMQNKVSWDDLSTSLVQLTNLDAIRSENFGATGLDQGERAGVNSMNDQDYELLKSSAWGTGKAMDFLSGLMHRSCTVEKQVVDSETGQVFKTRDCGDNYATSSGTTGGGKIVVGMRMAYSAPIVRYNISKRPPQGNRDFAQEKQQFDATRQSQEHFLTDIESNTLQQIEQQSIGTRTITFQEQVQYIIGQVSLDDGSLRAKKASADDLPTLLTLLEEYYPWCSPDMISSLRSSVEFARNSCRLAADKVKTMLDFYNTKNPQNAIKTIVVFEHSDGTSETIQSEPLASKDRAYQTEISKPRPSTPLQKPQPPAAQKPQTPLPPRPPAATAPKPTTPQTPTPVKPTQTGTPVQRLAPVPAQVSFVDRLIKVADDLDKRQQTGLVRQIEVLIKELKRIPA